MSVSLETRVPMLDHRVVEFAWRLPLAMKVAMVRDKWLLKQLLRKYIPAALIDRPKMGFGVPVSEWILGPLRDWAEDLSEDRVCGATAFSNPRRVREIWLRHVQGVFRRGRRRVAAADVPVVACSAEARRVTRRPAVRERAASTQLADFQLKSRKISLFLPSLAGGGAERVFVQLANEFARPACASTWSWPPHEARTSARSLPRATGDRPARRRRNGGIAEAGSLPDAGATRGHAVRPGSRECGRGLPRLLAGGQDALCRLDAIGASAVFDREGSFAAG